MSVLTIGTLYQKNYGGIAWSQPGGPGTQVFPTQNVGNYAFYPVSGQIWQELGLWTSGCNHWWDCMAVVRDFNDATNMSAACFLCPVCSYLINIVSPFEAIYNPLSFPILIP